MSNKLTNQSSPYLKAHSNDPINWYPWGREALAKARKENKPLFVSVGYQSCHWCQAMALDSFCDPQIGSLLNHDFISIMIDKDERPDLAHVFLNAATLSSGHSGWPLTAFCTPEGKAYYAATYLPKNASKGMPGLKSIIPQAARVWKTQQANVLEDAEKIQLELFRLPTSLLEVHLDPQDSTDEDPMTIDMESRYDYSNGGFDKAPKFPNYHLLNLLIRRYHNNQDDKYLNLLNQSLRALTTQGLYDHVGGGFYRYCVDEKWHYPHFEKITSDNAWAIYTLSQAYKVTQNHYFLKTAQETAQFLIRDLQSEQGLFANSLNADTEGREGAHYIWRSKEVFHVLGTLEGVTFCEWFGFSPEGNFPNVEGQLDGLHHLKFSADEFLKLDSEDFLELSSMKEKLLDYRQKRELPVVEDKFLCDTNAMVVVALFELGEAIQDSTLIDIADQLIQQINSIFQDKHQHILNSKYFGSFSSYLNDWAYLAWANYCASQSLGDSSYLQTAEALIDEAINQFWDQDLGGFFLTQEGLEYPQIKDFYDSSSPSGNSILLNCITLINSGKYEQYIQALQAAPRLTDPENLSYYGFNYCSHLAAP